MGLPRTARRVIELSSRALLVVQGGFRGKALFSAANALFQPSTMAGCVAQRGLRELCSARAYGATSSLLAPLLGGPGHT